MTVVRFMAHPSGRAGRILAGLVIMGIGIVVGGTAGWIVMAVGLVPIVVSAINVCLLAPVFRAPFRGTKVLKAR